MQTPKISVLLLLMLISGCASQPSAGSDDVPGFLSGIFHGLFIVGSMLGSILFDIRIYAFPNSGFFYDFGFVVGVLILVAYVNPRRC